MKLKMKGGSAETILYIIVLVVVLIAVALTAYFFANMYEQRKSRETVFMNRNPPRQFAEHIGLVCPDGWESAGPDPTDANRHLCKNVLHVPVNTANQAQCYNRDATAKLTSFENLDWSKMNNDTFTFPTTDPKPAGVNDIMNFVNQCGPSTNIPAVWTGVNTQNGWITF